MVTWYNGVNMRADLYILGFVQTSFILWISNGKQHGNAENRLKFTIQKGYI